MGIILGGKGSGFFLEIARQKCVKFFKMLDVEI